MEKGRFVPHTACVSFTDLKNTTPPLGIAMQHTSMKFFIAQTMPRAPWKSLPMVAAQAWRPWPLSASAIPTSLSNYSMGEHNGSLPQQPSGTFDYSNQHLRGQIKARHHGAFPQRDQSFLQT
jgi:hypothetical protein